MRFVIPDSVPGSVFLSLEIRGCNRRGIGKVYSAQNRHSGGEADRIQLCLEGNGMLGGMYPQ